MLKNVPVQNFGALKLVLFPGLPVTKISKLASMKSFDTLGKRIKKLQKCREIYA